jgi:hypothetical protein
MKVKEMCMTCAHHTAVLVRVDVDEETNEEIPVFSHLCNGKRISGDTVWDFRCGKYEPRAIL